MRTHSSWQQTVNLNLPCGSVWAIRKISYIHQASQQITNPCCLWFEQIRINPISPPTWCHGIRVQVWITQDLYLFHKRETKAEECVVMTSPESSRQWATGEASYISEDIRCELSTHEQPNLTSLQEGRVLTDVGSCQQRTSPLHQGTCSIPGGPIKMEQSIQSIFQDFALINSYFFTLLDRASIPHYNNTKIIKFGWELFIFWVISYGLSFSGFARFPEFRGTINDKSMANPENDSP